MKNIIILIVLLISSSSYSQKKYKDLKSEYNAQVECLGTGVKGSFVFKVYTSQRKRNPDLSKSKRAAIFTVIFNGIPGVPGVGCDTQPPLLSEDAYEQNKEYFDSFFNTGKFSQFISLSNSGSPDIVKMNKGYEIGLNVTVRRDALSKKLEDDGIRVGLRSIF